MKKLLALVAASSALIAQAAPVPVDGVAAYVNDSVITVGDVREAMAPIVAQMKAARGEDISARIKALYDETLMTLVENKLILAAYQADDKLNKEAVEKLVERRVGAFIQDRFGGSRQEFLKTLRDERVSIDEWRAKVREDIIVGIMRNREVDSQVVVSPREVTQAYESNAGLYSRPEQIKLSVLVVKGSTNETVRAERLQAARDCAQKIKVGEDVAAAARRMKEAGLSDSGGPWDWTDVADLRRELADGVRTLAVGATGDVIPVDGDYYIVRVDDRRKAGPVPFDDVRGTIERDLRRTEAKRLYRVWIDRLKKDAFIELPRGS